MRLPNGVFAPYTGNKTNLLFFIKGESTKEIWYFEHPYPNGMKSYSKTKPLQIDEFELEKEWWNEREENEYTWKVSVHEIKGRNYNLDIKNPKKADEEMELTSSEILQRLSISFQKSNNLIEKIKSILS